MSLHTVFRAAIFVTMVVAAGCGPGEPSVRYSGSTLAANPPAKLQVFRTTRPDRPYKELGSVDVSCPTGAQQGGFGSVAVVGGCTYEEALQMATQKAAESGADALMQIQTSAGGNGSIVSLQAVAVHYTGPAAPPPAPPVAAKPSAEERLRKLKALADQGLITDDEYARRKAEILADL